MLQDDCNSGCLEVSEIEPRNGILVFEKSNDSCQGSRLKGEAEESGTQGRFGGDIRKIELSRREMKKTRAGSPSLLHFPVLLF